MFVEMTLADGRKTSVPKTGLRLVEGLVPGSFEKHPEAQSFIVFRSEQNIVGAFLRDSFVQIMRLAPLAEGGAKWLDFKGVNDLPLAVVEGSIVGWVQLDAADDTVFQISVRARAEALDSYDVVSTFDDIRAITQTEIEAPEKKGKAKKVDDL